MKRFIIVVILLALFPYSIFAQGKVTIYGTVTDENTGKRLPFAGIQISGSLLGSICDEKGEFEYTIPANLAKNAILFSYTGHKKKEIAMSNFKNESWVVVQLTPLYKAVDEIVVHPLTAAQLIENCYKNIKQNYPQKVGVHIGKYQELFFENDKLIQDIQATLYTRKSPYLHYKSSADQMKISDLKIRKEKSQLSLWQQMIVINGPFELMFADFVKYRNNFLQLPAIKVNFLNPKEFKHYTYSYYEKLDKNDDTKYIIKFKPAETSKKGVYEGYIEIDKKTLAFIKMKFSYSPTRMKRIWKIASMFQIEMGRAGVLISDLAFDFEIFYRKKDNKYIPVYIATSNKFSYQEYYGAGENIITISEEYKLQYVDYKNIKKFKQRNRISRGVPMEKQNIMKNK